ncbi:uncharacterized protein LOC119273489 [Triticum dicoccoides]|uniref:uncharacterized protein LOC119273489 n=1 Tax=Triticum dicoccoides TaxID=85692 RepID=UPI00188EFA07|nr:uncharacterized protein LOC119273489 [Triticum dicoccoides]
MDRKVCISVVILALAVLAGPGAKAAALAGGAASIDAGAAVRQLMSVSLPSSMKLQDGVASELAVASVVNLARHRRLLSLGFPPAVLDNRAACNPTCPGQGQPYTDHGCNSRYLCRH